MDAITCKSLTEADVLALSAAYDEPEWLRDRRVEAHKAFAAFEWPHRRIEEWRLTDPARFALERPITTEAGRADARDVGIVVGAGELSGHARIVDGAVVEAVAGETAAAQGVVVTDLASAARSHPEEVADALGAAVGADTKTEALTLAALTGSVVVLVPPDVEVAKPIGITVQVTGAGTVLPRVLVMGGRHSRCVVYVDHSGQAQATVLTAVETVLGDGARADVVTAQDYGEGVQSIASHTGKVGRQADYRHLEISLGGDLLYIRPDVRLDGEGGNGELLGVYFTDDEQHVEHRSLIHHNASHTTSESIYKGALQGTSHAVWYGNILIEAHAKETRSDETNRNMILAEGARADSIPFLEIKTSDVAACGHHSSIGQVDELQLFYLQSRGISREEAARLLLLGFFAEITDRIQLPGVTEAVLAELEAEVRSGPIAHDSRRG